MFKDLYFDHFLMAYFPQFNCFFLMPVVEKFPALLRDDLEAAFEEDLDSVFDVVQARRALEQQRIDLEFEMKKVCIIYIWFLLPSFLYASHVRAFTHLDNDTTMK